MKSAAALALAVGVLGARLGAAQAPVPEVRALGGVPADVAALLAGSRDGGSLRLALGAAPITGAPGAWLLRLELDGHELLAGHPGGRLGVEIVAYAVGPGGGVLAVRHDGVALDIGDGAALEDGGVRYLARLDGVAELAELRVFARVRQSSLFGVRRWRAADATAAASVSGPAPPRFDAPAPGLTAAEVAQLVAAGALPALLPAAAPASSPPAAVAGGRPRRSAEVERLVPLYRAAYARVAAGERAAAVSELAALETATIQRSRDAIGWLARADGALLGPLSTAHPGALLPLALLYRDLLQAHLDGRHPGLARRAGAIAEELLFRAGDGAGGDERRLVAAALDGLAADYLLEGLPVRAAAVLERSAELDPGRVGRWLALAALHESHRRLPAAERALTRALAAAPGDREALLRRARVRGLAGDGAASGRELDALLAAPARDWVAIVAAEERARQHVAAGRLEAARAVLERAAASAPDEPSLLAALAWTRHRTGARAAALAAASQAAHARRALRVAPRRRYSEPPLGPLLASRSEAESAGLLRLDALAAALAAPGAR